MRARVWLHYCPFCGFSTRCELDELRVLWCCVVCDTDYYPGDRLVDEVQS